MTKFLVIGDPHFKEGNINETDEMKNKILSVIDEHNPDIIVCLGDVLHYHNKLETSHLNRAEDFLKKLQDKRKLFLIIGNHDRPNNSVFLTDEHPFNALKYWDNTTVVDYPCDTIFNNYRFIFVPYVFPGRFHEALSKLKDPYNCKCIFAHQEFYGAKMGSIESTEGDVWKLDNPLVVSGHVHEYDKLQENLIYTGTPIQHTFGENGKKTISIFDFDEYGYRETRIDLKLRKKKTTKIKPSCLDELNIDLNDKNRLVIECSAEEFKVIMKSQKIISMIESGVKVQHKDNSVNYSLVECNENFIIALHNRIKNNIRLTKLLNEIIIK